MGRGSRHILQRVIALVLIVVLIPLLILLCLVLLLAQGPPILFTQERVGLRGVSFKVYKFRTMRSEGAPSAHEQRVTTVGRFLRRHALDELPQLLNVIAGDMVFVGPRPTLPEQVDKYGPRERKRLQVRPGLTGWAQVNGRNAISWDRRIEHDIWYVENRTLALDLRILWRTLYVVVRGHGVYGESGVNPDFHAQTDSDVENSGTAWRTS